MPRDIAFEGRVAQLRQRIEATGEWVSLDGRIRPATVAKLLDRSEKTLRTWRAADSVVIPFTRIRGLATYAIADVLRFIESGGSERNAAVG